MTRQPAARASAARDNVAYTDVFRPGALAEIRSIIPDDALHAIDNTLLRSFVEGGLRMFGAKPGKLLKLVPRGWTLAYRDFCVPVFELIEPGRAELRFEDVAPQAFEAPGYLHCWHGLCQGIFDLEKPKDGSVEFAFDERDASAVARFLWTE